MTVRDVINNKMILYSFSGRIRILSAKQTADVTMSNVLSFSLDGSNLSLSVLLATCHQCAPIILEISALYKLFIYLPLTYLLTFSL